MRSILFVALFLSPAAALAADPFEPLAKAGHRSLGGALVCESRMGGKPSPSYAEMKKLVELEWARSVGSDTATLMMDAARRAVEAEALTVVLPPNPEGVTAADMQRSCEEVVARDYEALRVEGARFRQNAKTPPRP